MKEVICFHNPDEPNGYLSNWYLCDFQVNGIDYTSTEQFMMHQKAILFGDEESAEKIMDTSHVGKIKAYGRAVRSYNDEIWNRERYQIVYKGVLEKFRQNEELAVLLLMTEDAILAECAIKDIIWGIGLSMKDERRFNPLEWNGQNLLGKVLMQVREALSDINN